MTTVGLRRIQAARQGDPLLLAIFCGDAFLAQRSAILGALGPDVHVIATDSTHPDCSRDDLMSVAGAPFGELGVAGFSAGCHGVRNLLPSLDPAVVVTADGTHASMPGRPQTMPLEPWRRLAERAKRGEVLWVSSHTWITYVEQLKPPNGPYYSTVSTMRQATGWELPEPDGREPAVHEENDLVVESYRSGVADPADHARQEREVLPHLLRAYVRPRWAPAYVPVIGPAIDLASELPAMLDRLTGWLASLGEGLGARALHVAMRELGVHETAGPGNTARVLEYLAGCVRNGKPLGLGADSFEWCAAFFSWSAFQACRPGERPPHDYRAAVAELAADARASGRLRLAGTGYAPRPGDGAIFGRNGEDPLAGGHGHVVRVLDVDGGAFRSVGGNEGATGIVQVSPHVMTDPLLKAWIAYF
jgi:hypothetical protein